MISHSYSTFDVSARRCDLRQAALFRKNQADCGMEEDLCFSQK